MMNDLRKYINVLETAGNDELQKYRDEQKYWQNEREKYWPVSKELMLQYNDGSHHYEDSDGILHWENQNGEQHRDGDKPAIIDAYGTLEWYQNNRWHRLHGPAVIRPDDRLEWWINGEEITDEVNEWLGKKRWRGTPEQIFEFQLRFL